MWRGAQPSLQRTASTGASLTRENSAPPRVKSVSALWGKRCVLLLTVSRSYALILYVRRWNAAQDVRMVSRDHGRIQRGGGGPDPAPPPPWNCQIINFCHVEIFHQTPSGNLDPPPPPPAPEKIFWIRACGDHYENKPMHYTTFFVKMENFQQKF